MKFIIVLFLASCVSMPETPDGPQCSPVFKYSLDGNISVSDSYCICRLYHFGSDYVGPVKNTDPWIDPIQSCDRLVGWNPEEYTIKASYWENLRVYINSKGKNGKNISNTRSSF